MAAYGTHPTIKTRRPRTPSGPPRGSSTTTTRPSPTRRPTRPKFVNSTGAWANTADGRSITGLDDVDLWVGGLAESQNLFGGLLGSTFNYVFETAADRPAERRPLLLPAPHAGPQPAHPARGQLVRRADHAQHGRAEPQGRRVRHRGLRVRAGQPAAERSRQLIADDPTSECDESLSCIRMADGTIRYRQINAADPPGLNAQNTFNGTAERRQGSTAASTTTRSGATRATTASKATTARTWHSAARATTSSPTPPATTSSRAATATTPSTPGRAWT